MLSFPLNEDTNILSFHADTKEQLQTARVITAIKTPYKANGKFDLQAFDNIVKLQIEHGTDGLIIGGTTGEGQLMGWDEHIMLIAHTAKEFGKDILVIGNTGAPPTS
jgi:4-hydroxy-tetrahydrodipicolinate synthase